MSDASVSASGPTMTCTAVPDRTTAIAPAALSAASSTSDGVLDLDPQARDARLEVEDVRVAAERRQDLLALLRLLRHGGPVRRPLVTSARRGRWRSVSTCGPTTTCTTRPEIITPNAPAARRAAASTRPVSRTNERSRVVHGSISSMLSTPPSAARIAGRLVSALRPHRRPPRQSASVGHRACVGRSRRVGGPRVGVAGRGRRRAGRAPARGAQRDPHAVAVGAVAGAGEHDAASPAKVRRSARSTARASTEAQQRRLGVGRPRRRRACPRPSRASARGRAARRTCWPAGRRRTGRARARPAPRPARSPWARRRRCARGAGSAPCRRGTMSRASATSGVAATTCAASTCVAGSMPRRRISSPNVVRRISRSIAAGRRTCRGPARGPAGPRRRARRRPAGRSSGTRRTAGTGARSDGMASPTASSWVTSGRR